MSMLLPGPLVEAQALDGLLLLFGCFMVFWLLVCFFIVVIFVPNSRTDEKDL